MPPSVTGTGTIGGIATKLSRSAEIAATPAGPHARGPWPSVPRIRASRARSAGTWPTVTEGVQSRNALSHWNMNAATQVTSVSEMSGGRIVRSEDALG